jgi:hypothetical protein
LGLIKDYDLDIQYHPGKANLVADALSRKGQANMALAFQLPEELMKEIEKLNLWMAVHTEGVTLELESTLEQQIREGQLEGVEIRGSERPWRGARPRISQRMIRGRYGLRVGSVCLMWETFGRLS